MSGIRLASLFILIGMCAIAGFIFLGHPGPSLEATLKLIMGVLGLVIVVLSVIRMNRAKKKNESQQEKGKQE